MPRTNWHSQRLSKAPLSTFGTHRTNRQNQASSSNTQSASNEHHDTITNADNDEEEDDDELPGAYAINRQTSSDNIDEEWDPTATETMTRSAPTEDIRTEDADAVVQSEEIDQKLEDRQAEEQRDQKNKKKRCLMIVAGLLLIVAAIAAIVGVVVGQLRDNGDTTAGYADTSFPTDASLLDVLTSPCAGSDIRTSDDMTEVYIDIRSMIAVLLPNATINIDTPHSSQRHALCWVSGFDGFLKPTEESMIQRFALAVVYFSGIQSGLLESAHGGEFTLIDQNWLSAIHECDWKYISCTIDNEIDGLGLFSVGLIGTIPIELCLLTELRVLDMSKNELSGSIPSELSKVTHLERLQLKLNQLTGTILDEAKSLPSSLTDIDFSHNSLSGTISEFLDLPELKSLWLGFSGIGGTFPNLSKSKLLCKKFCYECWLPTVCV